MAKKSGTESTADTQRRRAGKQNSDAGKSESLRASASLRLKSSSLLDTRVVYCGDNLEQLAKLADACIDLIYIDPPFNSKRDYNLLFKAPKTVATVYDRREKNEKDDSAVTDSRYSEAQIEAFEDTWHWNQQAEREFDELLHQPNTDVAEMMKALHGFLGENDMMAYLTMMANRLLQLHRVLKSTSSLLS